MRLGGVVLVGVERDHRQQPLARGLAPRVLDLAKAGARREGARPCAREVEAAVIGVPERDVALRDAEAVADAVELGARLREQLAAALEPAHGLLDEGQQDEALRAPEHVAHLGAALHRLDQRGARPGVVAEQVVDLAQDDLRLRSTRGVPDASRSARGPATTRARPRAGCPRSLAMYPSRRSDADSLATSPACSKARRAVSASALASSSRPRVPERLAAPERRFGGVHAVQAALERLEVAQRGGRVAARGARRLRMKSNISRAAVSSSPALSRFGDAVLHDAPRAHARVLGQRVGGQPVDRRRVVALLEALEQVLLQERVRPPVLVVAHRQEDLRARERHEASRGSMPSEAQSVLSTSPRTSSPSAAAAYAPRRSSVGIARTRSSHSSAVVMGRPVQRVLGHAVLVAVERQVPAAGPRVEELQREERVAAALLDRAQHRRVVERQRRAQERLGVVGRERLELEDPALPTRRAAPPSAARRRGRSRASRCAPSRR